MGKGYAGRLRKSLDEILASTKGALCTGLAAAIAALGIGCSATQYKRISYDNANLQESKELNQNTADDLESFTKLLESKRAEAADDEAFLDDIWDNTEYILWEPGSKYFMPTMDFLLRSHYPKESDAKRKEYMSGITALVIYERNNDGVLSPGDYVAFIEPLEGVAEEEDKRKRIWSWEVKFPVAIPSEEPAVVKAYEPVVSPNGDKRDFAELGGGAVLPQENNDKDDKAGILWGGAGKITLGKGISLKANAFGENDNNFLLQNYLLGLNSAELLGKSNISITGYSGKKGIEEQETVRVDEPDARTRGKIDRKIDRGLNSFLGSAETQKLAATLMISNYKDTTRELHDLVVTPLDPVTGQPIGNPIPIKLNSDVMLDQLTGFAQLSYLLSGNAALGSDISYAVSNIKAETETNGSAREFNDKVIGQGIEPFGVYASESVYAYLGIPIAQVVGENVNLGINIDTGFIGKNAFASGDGVMIGANLMYLDKALRTAFSFQYTQNPSGAFANFVDFRRFELMLDKTGNEAYLPEMLEQLERNNFLSSLIANNAFGGRFTLDSPEDSREKAFRGLVGVPVPYYNNAVLFVGGSKVFHRENIPVKDAIHAGANIRILSTNVADIYIGGLYGYTNIESQPDKSEAQMWIGMRF